MRKTTTLGRALKLAAVPLVLASLAACASPFRADVSRFQTQLPAPAGQTFAVVADDPALAGGLEFARYADFVEAQMARLGYVQASSPESATMLVRFDYGVDNGRERITTRPGFGYHDPFFGGPEVESYTVFTSGIEMKIDDQATGQRLFEGKAQALSTSNRLQYLVPNLVEAMFTDFPGNSGETVRISVAPEDMPVQRR